MAEIVNLRRARKTKARGEREKEAATNRTQHGTPTRLRKAAKVGIEQQTHKHGLHEIDRDDKH